MSLEAIWDAVARQSGTVTGIKGAYATRAGGQGTTVRAFPDDIADGPVAVIDYAGSELLNVAPFERIAHDFDIALWHPLRPGTRSTAVQVLAPMFERFAVAFRNNVGLYGTAHMAVIQGSTGFADEELNDKDFLVQRIQLRAQEARTVTAAIGPSS